jgi:putative phage-type endonuclease
MSAVPALLVDDRQAWLEARRQVVTATDVAAISGVHPYKTPRLVYMEKKGLLAETEPNEFMQLGTELEPYIGAKFARETGLEIVKGDFTVHAKHSHFGCTPDYLTADGEAVVECKWAGINAAQNFGEPGTDAVPDQYVCQVMWQMICTGRKMGYLAALLGTGRFHIYEIPYDSKLASALIYQANQFWADYILNDNPPPISGQDADAELLKTQYPISNSVLVTSTTEIDMIATELKLVKEQSDLLEIKKTQLENQLKEFMGEADALTTQEGKFTWKSQDRKKTEWAEIAKQMEIPPSVIEAHTSVVSSRVFRTPFKGAKA